MVREHKVSQLFECPIARQSVGFTSVVMQANDDAGNPTLRPATEFACTGSPPCGIVPGSAACAFVISRDAPIKTKLPR